MKAYSSNLIKFTNEFVEEKVISLVMFMSFIAYANESNALNL